MKKVIIITILFILCGAVLSPATVLAETANSENQKHLSDCLIPKDSMYYEGHTYLAFAGEYTWDEANILCNTMGGHLVSLETNKEQSAVTKLSVLGWTGACAFSEENTRDWVWYHSGEVIGVMHELQEGSETDQFYYTPNSNNVWDALTNEPNSWRTPWDQCVAELNDRGLNTLMPSDKSGFICEYDSMLAFSIVDLNYDLNYTLEILDGKTKAWNKYPANYTDGYLQGVGLTFGQTYITPEYPDNPNYNFMGYCINNNTNDVWQGGEYPLHMENSKWYIGETELMKPVVTLYAIWEKAELVSEITQSDELLSTITPMITNSPIIPADRAVEGPIATHSNNSALPVIGGIAAVIAVSTVGGYTLLIRTNIEDFKESINLLQENPSAPNDNDSLTSAPQKKTVDKKEISRIRYPFLYIKFRKYSYILGQKDVDGSGKLIRKVKLKFKSRNKLSIDLTEELKNNVYQLYRIRHPRKAMKRRKDVTIAYLNKEGIIEQDHFNSMSDFVHIKIIEK